MAKSEDKRSRRRRSAAPNGRKDDAVDGQAAAESANNVHHLSAVPQTDYAIELPPLDPEMFINRELSWLDFNNRVLFEAEER
ncbi:MAG: hypothetical protein KY456_13200, partial [Chloroflexi bacterium]|nr:hypothetical protein [Chloroflexota bacterium]